MTNACKHIIIISLVSFIVVGGNALKGWTKNQDNKNSGSTNLQQRIDFGNAYIMGQSIQSGAVYLLHRKQSDIKSMLQYRENYRKEILEDFKIREDKTHDAQLNAGDKRLSEK